MSETEGRGLDGFGAAARRAIEAAADAARELGTVRVGTEHLLLGVLAVGSSAAADLLRSAGAGRSAVRRKVGETNVGRSSPSTPGAPVARSPRADRALSRAHRFAHDRRAPEARSEHLLLGILDVEGTAGQVLRGLDVDVDALRARLQQADLGTADGVDAHDPPPPSAPSRPCHPDAPRARPTSATSGSRRRSWQPERARCASSRAHGAARSSGSRRPDRRRAEAARKGRPRSTTAT